MRDQWHILRSNGQEQVCDCCRLNEARVNNVHPRIFLGRHRGAQLGQRCGVDGAMLREDQVDGNVGMGLLKLWDQSVFPQTLDIDIAAAIQREGYVLWGIPASACTACATTSGKHGDQGSRQQCEEGLFEGREFHHAASPCLVEIGATGTSAVLASKSQIGLVKPPRHHMGTLYILHVKESINEEKNCVKLYSLALYICAWPIKVLIGEGLYMRCAGCLAGRPLGWGRNLTSK